MSIYWNKVVLDKMFSKSTKNIVKYKINTELGRVYLYFEKGDNERVSGKFIFYPKEKETTHDLSGFIMS